MLVWMIDIIRFHMAASSEAGSHFHLPAPSVRIPTCFATELISKIDFVRTVTNQKTE